MPTERVDSVICHRVTYWSESDSFAIVIALDIHVEQKLECRSIISENERYTGVIWVQHPAMLQIMEFFISECWLLRCARHLHTMCVTFVRCLLRITHSRYSTSAVQILLILLVVVRHLDSLGLSNVHCTSVASCAPLARQWHFKRHCHVCSNCNIFILLC